MKPLVSDLLGMCVFFFYFIAGWGVFFLIVKIMPSGTSLWSSFKQVVVILGGAMGFAGGLYLAYTNKRLFKKKEDKKKVVL